MGSIRTDQPRHRRVFDFFFAICSAMDNFDIDLPWRLRKIAEFRSKLNWGSKLLEARTKNAFVVILSQKYKIGLHDTLLAIFPSS